MRQFLRWNGYSGIVPTDGYLWEKAWAEKTTAAWDAIVAAAPSGFVLKIGAAPTPMRLSLSCKQPYGSRASRGLRQQDEIMPLSRFCGDKIAASKRKGLWVGGMVPLGYETKERKITINQAEAETVRTIFRCYLELGS